MALGAAMSAARPAIAQSNSGFELARTSVTSVREYVAAESIPTQLSPPPNVVASEAYRHLLDVMLRGSPTFRRQCLRIGSEPLLTVYINLAPPSWPTGVRAVTRFRRQPDGRLSAHIAIGAPNDAVELLAHEFEHIIEQVDGVDLAALAARPRTGVRRQMPDAFETARATRVGLRVTGELRQ